MKKIIERLKTNNLMKYQSIPFWSWNAELKPEQLVNQIRWMKDSGIGGFFMHARSGLKTEYMSEEWMECIKACVEEAKRLGMDAWAYDENGWPSGFAGGKLLEEESNRDQYILHTVGDYDPNADISYYMDGDKLVRVKSGDRAGEYLNLFIHVAASTVDILNPEVVKQFIGLTHEKYKAYFGDNFSESIRGFFTDEPQYYRYHTPYTRMISQYFENVYGEDIRDSLGLLFVEKEGYRTFRYRYWKGMQELMLRNYAEQVYNWCENNGIELTGHYIEEITLGFQMMCCGGCMPFYEFEHIPGIDWLGVRSDNELSPRQVGSAAAQLGKKHVITETFAGCGWNVTPAELRRIACFQYVNGVNQMCQHLIPYAEYGNRKRDFPAHFSTINPWVHDRFRDFNDYFTRLGYLLAESKEQVNVAVFHPIRSAYFDYKREEEETGFGIQFLNDELMRACRILSGADVAYHFLDETLLERHGFVQDGKIGCGICSYDYLVFPTIYTMDKHTEKLLRNYVEHGGKVLLLGEKPTYLEGEPYAYAYLESNCSLEHIIDAQPYRVENRNTEIFSTYREMEDDRLLFVINASKDKEYTQTFDMGEGINSFIKVDLNSYEMTRVPLTLTLKAGEAVVLFTDKEKANETHVLVPYELRFENAEVCFEENLLPIDFVRFSEDGIHYSEKWPCVALFQKLLEDRKEGTIYLKYEFEVRKIPEQVFLRAERCDAESITFNGTVLDMAISGVIEEHVLTYDVSPYIKEGINEYCVKMNWHESEDVYYALFGENVTESLRNCIVYDSELEPIYIAGQFGVYTDDGFEELPDDSRYVSGNHFYLGEVPNNVSEPIKAGFPFLAGRLTLKQTVEWTVSDILLQVKGSYQVAEVIVNGLCAGTLLFDKELDASAYAKVGENEIEVSFVLGNYNLMGPQHLYESKEHFCEPQSFELNGSWENEKSPKFHNWYDLRKLYE